MRCLNQPDLIQGRFADALNRDSNGNEEWSRRGRKKVPHKCLNVAQTVQYGRNTATHRREALSEASKEVKYVRSFEVRSWVNAFTPLRIQCRKASGFDSRLSHSEGHQGFASAA